MPHINPLALLLCGASSLLLGAIWYSPFLFGRRWQRETALSDEALAKGSMPLIYGLAFLLSCVAALALAHVLSFARLIGHEAGAGHAIGVGAAAGLFWVAAAFAINYLFERRSFTLWAINAGYHVLQFALFGAILALMA